MGHVHLLVIGAVVAMLLSLAGTPPAAYAATITVTTTTDELNSDGDCALREAIRAAHTDSAVDAWGAGSGADTITVPAGTYTLILAGRDEDAALTGDLDITSDVTINGASAATTIIDGNKLDRVFDVRPGAAARISGITIRNGLWRSLSFPEDDRGGGGLANYGELDLIQSVVTTNRTDPAGEGGGIYNAGEGTMRLVDSRITNNRVEPAPPEAQDGTDGDAGGISNWGTLTIDRSTISSNTIGGQLGEASGDGIWNIGTLLLRNSVVEDNIAYGSASPGFGEGGGINNAGTATIIASSIRNNCAEGGYLAGGRGAGIHNFDGDLTITNSTITGNISAGGASGASGGGIYNWAGGTVKVSNSTISGNVAGTGTGGFEYARPASNGGGIFNNYDYSTYTNTVSLDNVTIAWNKADVGGGVNNGAEFEHELDGSYIVRLTNSIIADNTTNDGGTSDCAGPLQSQGYNLIKNVQGCTITGDTTGNLLNVDPNLGPLADNGGPTQTHALLPGSPKIDAGNPAQPGSGGNACEPLDQRGITRPQDGNGDGVARCDIGAFERLAAVPPRLAGVSARCNDEYPEINATITIKAWGEPVTLTALNADLEGATGERGTFRPNLVGQTLPIGTTTIAVTFRGYQFDPNAELRVTVTATFGHQAQSQTVSNPAFRCDDGNDDEPAPSGQTLFMPIITK